MCDYDKPFRTYDEQISYLKTCHGLDIHDADFARRVLRSISYYDIINGYKDSFMEGDKFKPHISIEFLYQFSSLQLLSRLPIAPSQGLQGFEQSA